MGPSAGEQYAGRNDKEQKRRAGLPSAQCQPPGPSQHPGAESLLHGGSGSGGACRRLRHRTALCDPDPGRGPVPPVCGTAAAAGRHHQGDPGRDLRCQRHHPCLHQRGVDHLGGRQVQRCPPHHLQGRKRQHGADPHPRHVRGGEPGADPAAAVRQRRGSGCSGHLLRRLQTAVRKGLQPAFPGGFLLCGPCHQGEQRRKAFHREIRFQLQ